MTVIVRLPRVLYANMLADLQRPHAFAYERVGILYTHHGRLDRDGVLVLGQQYEPVADEHYINDPNAGARIDSAAIRSVLQHVFDDKVGAFHVHLHDHRGTPRWSGTDRRELPPLVASFRNAARNQAHGLLLLSQDSGQALVWTPTLSDPVTAERVGVLGAPTIIWRS